MAVPEFLLRTHNLPPDPLLVEAVSFVEHPKRALDLGAGAGRDTRSLLEQGLEVTSVDTDLDAIQMLQSLPYQEHLRVVRSAFSDFEYDNYDLVNARFALPFHHGAISFTSLFRKIIDSLNPGGVFVGQLFGNRDEFNTTKTRMTFHTREEVEQLLQGLDVLRLKEVEYDGTLTLGTPKHWHIFHIIARRPKSANAPVK